MPDLLLLFVGLVALVAAIGVIAAREAVHSALYLTVHLLSIGALFLSLHHQFLAMAQMLVYAGAVMVVFMFAVTTLAPHEEPLNLMSSDGLPLFGILTGMLTFGGIYWSFSGANLSERVGAPASAEGLVAPSSFAADLFGPFLLPFEGTAFLLLTALVGAVILGGRRQLGDG